MNIISKGIDISRWQGDFNLAKAVSDDGVKFVIVKGGGGDDGLYTDSKFAINYEKAKNLSLPTGVYWFSKALTVAAAEQEADYFYEHCLKGRQFELPVYIDVENRTQLSVGKTLLTNIIKAWCNRLEAKGFWVGIYSSLSYFGSYMNDSELTRYAHWVAQWSKSCTYKNESCLGMWQYGGETNLICSNKIAGVTCDQNYMLVDYPSKIKAAGLNGFAKASIPAQTPAPAPAAPVKKSNEQIAAEVINGSWGNGQDRVNRLTAAGYDYNTIQNIVNQKLNPTPAKKSVDTIAREVIRGEWGNGQDRKNRLIAAGYNYSEVQARVNQLL
jgi:lysozyme